MYSVYQIPFEVLGLNNPLRSVFSYDDEDLKLIADNFDLYEEVAIFDVKNKEEVYKASNFPSDRDYWESKIKRLKEMYSVSVKDVIKDPNGDLWVVAKFGFKKLPRSS